MCKSTAQGGRRCAGYYRKAEIRAALGSASDAATTADRRLAYQTARAVAKTRAEVAMVEKAVKVDTSLRADDRAHLLDPGSSVDGTIALAEAEAEAAESTTLRLWAEDSAWRKAEPTVLEAGLAQWGVTGMTSRWGGLDHRLLVQDQVAYDLEMAQVKALGHIPGVGRAPRPRAAAGEPVGVSLRPAPAGSRWKSQHGLEVKWQGTGSVRARREYALAMTSWMGRVFVALSARARS